MPISGGGVGVIPPVPGSVHTCVGWSGVANLANTTDGFALHTSASNVIGSTEGDDVGDHGVVDLYGYTNSNTYYILMENSGYVLQETDDKIILEIS